MPASNDPANGDINSPSLAIPKPNKRPLKAFAYDPSRGQRLGNMMSVDIRYEKLAPGPIGSRFAVVDYDGAEKCYYAPVDLDDPAILIQGGLSPSEVDPRFHQQMVYAVASETLERFEAALGRRVHWRIPTDEAGQEVHHKPNRLYLHPHAMRQANAFYSPAVHGILFGYFRASMTDPGANLPGQTVFTCLSHDIVAHETTHAIVDGIRAYFMEPTNIDVPAFHEAFADLAALFRHFSHKETLIDTLQKTGGRLYAAHLKAGSSITPDSANSGATGPVPDPDQTVPADDSEEASPDGATTAGAPHFRPDGKAAMSATIQADIAEDNPLIGLATQFGQASAMHGALRSAIGTPPNSNDILIQAEPHTRGSILVAAVFDAYFTVYLNRATPLLRTYRAGGRTSDDLPQALAELLSSEASRTADMFFTLCARALDYCPPVDITFGDFLRALITADRDFYPDDTSGVRDASMQAFRLRGIVAEDAQSFSEASLCWPELDEGRLEVKDLRFGDPNGLTSEEKKHNREQLLAWAQANAAILGFKPAIDIEVPSFHPMFRIAQDGTLKIEMVVEIIQTPAADPESGDPLVMRSGVTLIIAKPPVRASKREEGGTERGAAHVRYAIAKHLSPQREQQIRTVVSASEVAVKDSKGHLAINFGLVHGGA